jgi:CO dehydrogenase maturation factor
VRVAVIGSGGVGKSVISATLARLLARRGRDVLAVDLDPNPGMAWSLGVAVSDAGLPEGAIGPLDGGLYGWGLRSDVDPATGIDRFAVVGPDGVRFLASAKIDRGDHVVTHHLGAVRQIVDAAPLSLDVVGDLEAGTTTPYEGYASFAEQLVLVVTPSWRSGLAGRRLRGLFPDTPLTIVGSQFRDEADHPDLPAVLRVPFATDVRAAEQMGVAPLDACPKSAAIDVIANLVDILVTNDMRAKKEAPV